MECRDGGGAHARYVSHSCGHRTPTWVDGSGHRSRPAFRCLHLPGEAGPVTGQLSWGTTCRTGRGGWGGAGSCLAAAWDPSPPGTWGGKRSAQLPAIPRCTRGHPAGPHSYLYGRLPSSTCTQGPSPFLPDDRTCPDQRVLPWN